MPDASGRFRGITLSGIENPWLDSLARVEEHETHRTYVVIDETHHHTPEQLAKVAKVAAPLCKMFARFPTDALPYCACMTPRCAKERGGPRPAYPTPTAYEEAMVREHNR